MRVTGIFTSTTISPGGLSRQCPNHYAIRAGQNLPDKEFRYLRTVIVTAAVYRGLNSELRCLTPPLNLPAPGRRQPIYVIFRFSIDLCFWYTVAWAYSLRPLSRLPFFRTYGVNLPSSLTTLLPLALGFSPHLPVSVCGTGTLAFARAFLASGHRGLRYSIFAPFRPGLPTPGFRYPKVSLWFKVRWLRNFYRMCIDYALRPRLSSRLTLGGRTFPKKP